MLQYLAALGIVLALNLPAGGQSQESAPGHLKANSAAQALCGYGTGERGHRTLELGHG